MKTAHKILLTLAVLCVDNSYGMDLKKRKKIPNKKKSNISDNSPLFHAARTNNVKKISECISKNEDLNTQDDQGRTAAMIAAEYGHFDVLQVLINQKADTRIQDNQHKTALDFAKQGGHKPCFDLLLKKSGKRRFLWHVVTKSALNIFSKDSELGLSRQERSNPSHYFFFAVQEQNLERANKLLICGANINAKTGSGETALHRAAQNGNFDGVQFLIKHGAKLDSFSKKGETPLHFALRANKKQCTDCLVSFGANVNAVDPEDKEGNTLLHKVAQEQDSVELAQYLIEYKAKVDIKNRKGETPLWIAFQHSRMNMVHLLIKAGADINTKNLKGETLLHDACNRDVYGLVKELLSFDQINLNLTDQGGKTALLIALHNGHKNILDLLVQKYMKLNKDKDQDKNEIKSLLALQDHDIVDKLAKKLMKSEMTEEECIVCYEKDIGRSIIPCDGMHPKYSDDNKEAKSNLICYDCVSKIEQINKECPLCRKQFHPKLLNELHKQHKEQIQEFMLIAQVQELLVAKV